MKLLWFLSFSLLINTRKMNTNIINNYAKLKWTVFIVPALLLIGIAIFLYSQDAFSVQRYVEVQKSDFYFFNHLLGQNPNLEYNLTQLGDCLISFAFLSVFLVYAPKKWEVLISASLVSAIFANVLKKIVAVPRPAAVFDNSTFTIVGKTLTGNNSLPSGHSITIFTTLTVLMFAYMPKNPLYKAIYFVTLSLIGLFVAMSRVGVGAHYPLDVIFGCIFGYISGLLGIFISRKYKIWSWISNRKFYPIFIILFLVCFGVIAGKIMHENLPIFYLALASLAISLYKITTVYVKKQYKTDVLRSVNEPT